MDRKELYALGDKLATKLLTHDMRYMWVKLFMPRLVTRVNMEGSPSSACFQILDEVSRQGNYDQLKEGLEKLFPGEDFSNVKK